MHILISIDGINTLLPGAITLIQNLEEKLSTQRLYKKLSRRLPVNTYRQWEITANINEVEDGQLVSKNGIHIRLFYRQLIRVNMPFGIIHTNYGFETRVTGQFLDLHEYDLFLTPDERIRLKSPESNYWGSVVLITELKSVAINISEHLRVDLDLK